MMKREPGRKKAMLIAGLVFVILFAHLPVVYTHLYHDLTGVPSAAGGVVDVSGLPLAGTVVLDGEWEFCWKQLIGSQGQTARPDFFIRVPDYWSKYKIDGNWLPAGGYASYRLTLRGLSSTRPVTVYIPDFGSAYRIYVDGALVSESGNVSEDAGQIFTVPRAKLYPAMLSVAETHEVVVEVASTRFSGLYMAPVIQEYDYAVREAGYRSNLRFLLFGTVLFSCFVLIVIHFLSVRNRVHSVWLPSMIVCVLLRIMLTTEFYSFWQSTVFINLSYEATNELMYLATFVLKFLLIFLLQEQFGLRITRLEKYGFLAYYAAIYLVYLHVPQDVYNRDLTLILPISTFALEFHAFFRIYFSRERLKKYDWLVFWSIVMAITGLIIDCYYLNGNIYANLSLALLTSLSVCLMTISVAYALRIANVHNDLAVSSSRLTMARAQIEMQREYFDALSGQVNEVRAIRHDIRHFIGALQRLAGEGRLEELNRFINEYEQSADTDPLPVFCDNVVANSILGYYAIKARNAAIPYHCTCSIPKRLSISDSDLCVVLGNALENAIEACEKLDQAEARFILAEARIMNGQLLVRIENSYDGRVNVGADGYLSTKNEEFHGMGIRNMKKIVEAYGGFVKTEHDGAVFTLQAAFSDTHKAEEV